MDQKVESKKRGGEGKFYVQFFAKKNFPLKSFSRVESKLKHIFLVFQLFR
jgi:hypothetical protein